MDLAYDLKIACTQFFLFFFCEIDQHDILKCINGQLYDDKISG